MTDPTPTLTPTEDLILDVLAARHRLGEGQWTFDSRLRSALRRLAERGLVTVSGGIIEHTMMASLTEDGVDHALDTGYVPPTERPDSPTWYAGPKTAGHRLDCDLPNHHSGEHRWDHAGLRVAWTSDEAHLLWAHTEMRLRRYTSATVTGAVASIRHEKPHLPEHRVCAHAAERLLLSVRTVDLVLAHPDRFETR